MLNDSILKQLSSLKMLNLRSKKQWQNHEKSKKHMELKSKLEKELLEDEIILNNEIGNWENDISTTVEAASSNSKISKKKKKSIKSQNKFPDNYETNAEVCCKHVLDVNDSDIESNQIDSDFDQKISTRARKKALRKRRGKQSNSVNVDDDKVEDDTSRIESSNQLEESRHQNTPICTVCGMDFSSRTQLFKHLKQTGHAALK